MLWLRHMKRTILLLSVFILSSCVGSGDRKALSLTSLNEALKTEQDSPSLNKSVSSLLITREAGSYELSSLYLSEYLKTNSAPAIQFYNNDEIISEILADDQAELILIKDATDLDVTSDQIAEGESYGNSIPSSGIANESVWVLKKSNSSVKYQLVFKIIDYKPGKSLKLNYKLTSFSYL